MEKEFYFVVFLINQIADALQEPVSLVYEKLKSVEAIHDYIIPHYEVLHTLGTEYLVEDLQEFCQHRGVWL
ncbi:MAG: DUF3791 domain-containing protein [Spirochaetaceae bacterium]|nr:DUF3791 domain-containing protein [Spirochaetaceae bacterium]MBR2361076.1 DUF3791 domain-containing protein [Spirochaetaceae bacterium]